MARVSRVMDVRIVAGPRRRSVGLSAGHELGSPERRPDVFGSVAVGNIPLVDSGFSKTLLRGGLDRGEPVLQTSRGGREARGTPSRHRSVFRRSLAMRLAALDITDDCVLHPVTPWC